MEVQSCYLSLDHAPSYETVSYVWGDNKRLHSLNLAEETLLITESISKELPLLSPHCKTGYLWIDQLCHIFRSIQHQAPQKFEVFDSIA